MLSYVEISKGNLIHNFKSLKSLVGPSVKTVCVIKANAYGHGQNETAVILEDHADYFQVDDLQELGLLREVSGKPTLVLGYVAEDEIAEALKLDGILAVYSEKQLESINRHAGEMGKRALVHVKIDACLGRQGVLSEDAEAFARGFKKYGNLVLDGVYSHFANIEDTSDFSHAAKQIEAYRKAVRAFEAEGFERFQTHISATSGVLVHEGNGGNSSLVRLGLGLYGMWPSEDLRRRFESDDFRLKPVMRWVTRVAQVKTVPAGYSIGYGLTYITNKPTKIAIIPQGYSDGYDRGLSNAGEVLVQGRRCRVLGRVAMNMFAADVSHLVEVGAEDEVVLLGRQGGECIRAEEVADRLGTINYEITTRISPLLRRITV